MALIFDDCIQALVLVSGTFVGLSLVCNLNCTRCCTFILHFPTFQFFLHPFNFVLFKLCQLSSSLCPHPPPQVLGHNYHKPPTRNSLQIRMGHKVKDAHKHYTFISFQQYNQFNNQNPTTSIILISTSFDECTYIEKKGSRQYQKLNSTIADMSISLCSFFESFSSNLGVRLI